MQQCKRLCSCLLAICFLLNILSILPAQATEATDQPAKTSNVGDYEYAYDRWTNPVNSYLVPNSDGTLTRVEFTGSTVAVETYGQDLQFVCGMLIDAELPLFGGFCSGQNYNFLVFGQTNLEEDDSKEVIRVVCYTKTWDRVGAASLYGANTTVPFDAGAVRFAEYGGYLYIRTAHEMYTSSDGLNHQANLTFNVRISDMTITESAYSVSNNNWGYVSHSFNQFIAVDGTTLIAADHGDAHPRAVMLTKYYAPAGQDKFLQPTRVDLGDGRYTYRYAQTLNILPIAGAGGDNDTGVSLGGFECSDSSYLVAGNTTSQGDDYDPYGQRNIFIAVGDKENFTTDGVTIRYLTNYTDGVWVSNPHFIEVGNGYCILWAESDSETDGLRYAFVDGKGQLQGGIYNAPGMLSDCQPVVSNGKLVWYVTNASAPAFFTIDLSDPQKITHDHVYTYEITSYPSYSKAGSLSACCAVCGEAGEAVEIPAITNYQHYTLYQYDVVPTCTQAGSGYYTWNRAKDYGVTNYAYYAPTPALGHSYVDGVCSSCGEADPNARELIKWVGTQLQATSNLDMQFALRISDLEGTTGNYIVLTRYFAQGDTPAEEIVIDQVDWTESNGFYIVAYSGIAAKEMGDVISAVAYNADGDVISETRNESIVTYALSMLGKITNEEQKTMFVDLLNYGAEAQKFFHYDESNLANAGLTEAQKAWGTQENIEVADHRVKGENFVGSQLSLENVILLQMAFKVTPVEGMYAVVTYTDHNGKSVNNTLAVENNAGFSMVSVNSLAIADYRTLVTCTVYNADGEIVGYAVDSMESYVARSGNDLGAAIMRFGASAYAYFH